VGTIDLASFVAHLGPSSLTVSMALDLCGEATLHSKTKFGRTSLNLHFVALIESLD